MRDKSMFSALSASFTFLATGSGWPGGRSSRVSPGSFVNAAMARRTSDGNPSCKVVKGDGSVFYDIMQTAAICSCAPSTRSMTRSG